MGWLEDKIAEFSRQYQAHGYAAEAFPPVKFHESGNHRDISHLIHLRATKGGERHLFRFENLTNEDFEKNRNSDFEHAMNRLDSYTAYDLSMEARECTVPLELEGVPCVKFRKNKDIPYAREVPHEVAASRWYEATAHALEREIRVIEAHLPIIHAIDRQDYFVRRGLESFGEYTGRKSTKLEMEHEERVRRKAETLWPASHHPSLHVFTYNGIEQLVSGSFARILGIQRVPFKLYWNDREVLRFANRVEYGPEWKLNGFKKIAEGA